MSFVNWGKILSEHGEDWTLITFLPFYQTIEKERKKKDTLYSCRKINPESSSESKGAYTEGRESTYGHSDTLK